MLDHKWLQDAKSTQSDTDGAKRIIKEYTIRKANMVSMRKTLKDVFNNNNNSGNTSSSSSSAAAAGGPGSPRGKGGAAGAGAGGGPGSPRGKVSIEDDGVHLRPRKSVMGTLSSILGSSTSGADQKSGRHLALDGGFSHKLPTALQGRYCFY